MKKILVVLIALITVLGFVACSNEPEIKEITVHVPNTDLDAKASEWQNNVTYILYVEDNIDYYCPGTTPTHYGAVVTSTQKSSEAVVKYHEGDSIYEMLSHVFVTEPLRRSLPGPDEELSFISILVYMTRYGIGDLPFSKTGFLQDVEYDWNQKVSGTDLYICFTEN